MSGRVLSRGEKAGVFSILRNVRDHGIRSATDADEVNGIRLACALILEECRAKPRLPRVSPENLVEDRFYVVRMNNGWESIGRASRNEILSDHELFLWVDDVEWAASNIPHIWGPIPEFDLEGE